MKTRPTIKHLSSSQVLHGAAGGRGEAEAGLEAPREGEALNGTQLPWPFQPDWIGVRSLFLPSSLQEGGGGPYYTVSLGNSVRRGSSGHTCTSQVSRAL